MKANILIVEDETNLGKTLKEYLNSKGHSVQWAATCDQARLSFNQYPPQIILMDIGLPDGTGLELAREFQKINNDLIILFLSAQNDPEIKVEGLELGAVDYITKPFALKELTFRLDRIQYPSHLMGDPDLSLKIDNLNINFKEYSIKKDGHAIIQMTHKECAILQLLFRHKNEVVNRDEILNQIWGHDKFPSNRTVDNYIVKLRKYIEDPERPTIKILSIRSIGYKLQIDERK